MGQRLDSVVFYRVSNISRYIFVADAFSFFYLTLSYSVLHAASMQAKNSPCISLKTAPTLFYIFKYVYVKLMRLPPPTYKGN